MARPLGEIDPFEPHLLADPFEFDRRLRHEAPVHRDPKSGVFLVSTYELILVAVRDFETFSNHFASAAGALGLGVDDDDPQIAQFQRQSYPIVDTMLTADPPEHRRFRGLVNKAFTPRRVEKLRDAMRGLCHELIDAFVDAGRCEVLADYAVPLPLTIIADQLGVSRADLPHFKRWTDGFTARLSGVAQGEETLEAMQRILEFQHYFAVRIDEAGSSPRDDILSDLVRARVDGERPLDVGEQLSILQQLLVAGNETTANAIAEGIRHLATDPALCERVGGEPALIPGFVEEVLRLASPVQGMWRRAKRDAELGGVAIPAGSLLLLRYGSANRDESVFRDPDRLDPGRGNAADHLAFGHGIHFCLGAMLARAELRTAFGALLERTERLRLSEGAAPLRYRPSILLRGLTELNVSFAPKLH
jgi:cytochrome P450